MASSDLIEISWELTKPAGVSANTAIAAVYDELPVELFDRKDTDTPLVSVMYEVAVISGLRKIKANTTDKLLARFLTAAERTLSVTTDRGTVITSELPKQVVGFLIYYPDDLFLSAAFGLGRYSKSMAIQDWSWKSSCRFDRLTGIRKDTLTHNINYILKLCEELTLVTEVNISHGIPR